MESSERSLVMLALRREGELYGVPDWFQHASSSRNKLLKSIRFDISNFKKELERSFAVVIKN